MIYALLSGSSVARLRGSSHADRVVHARLVQRDSMRCTLSRTDIGLLAQPESVLALAPPAAPSAVLASLWRGRWSGGAPFCFPFFFLPLFLLPEVTLCSKEFGWREGRQWATILAQALANLIWHKSDWVLCAVVKASNYTALRL